MEFHECVLVGTFPRNVRRRAMGASLPDFGVRHSNGLVSDTPGRADAEAVWVVVSGTMADSSTAENVRPLQGRFLR